MRAGDVRLLGTMLNSPGFCDEVTLLYLATGPRDRRARSRHGEEERYIEVVEIALADVDALVGVGRRSSTPRPSSACSWRASSLELEARRRPA